jgi:hypothetical protein
MSRRCANHEFLIFRGSVSIGVQAKSVSKLFATGCVLIVLVDFMDVAAIPRCGATLAGALMKSDP